MDEPSGRSEDSEDSEAESTSPTVERSADLAAAIADTIQARSANLAVAESCTAGALAATLAEGGNGSQWLRAGLVAYQDEVKRKLLDVRASSTVTRRAAAEMASGAARLFDTEHAVATTGVFGDDPVDGVEPGTVMVATYIRGDVRVTENHFDDEDPEALSHDAVLVALGQLLEHLGDRSPAGRSGSDLLQET